MTFSAALVISACSGAPGAPAATPKGQLTGKPAAGAGVEAPGLGPGGRTTTLAAHQLVEQLHSAGLPLRVTVNYTAANDPEHLLGAPGGYVSKAAFVDGRIPAAGLPDSRRGSVWLGGLVEIFSSPVDAERRQRDLAAAAADPNRAEYVYVRGNVVLRVSHRLDATYADGYAKLLARAG